MRDAKMLQIYEGTARSSASSSRSSSSRESARERRSFAASSLRSLALLHPRRAMSFPNRATCARLPIRKERRRSLRPRRATPSRCRRAGGGASHSNDEDARANRRSRRRRPRAVCGGARSSAICSCKALRVSLPSPARTVRRRLNVRLAPGDAVAQNALLCILAPVRATPLPPPTKAAHRASRSKRRGRHRVRRCRQEFRRRHSRPARIDIR